MPLKGYKQTLEHKKNRLENRVYLSGEKSSNWKGGLTKNSKEYKREWFKKNPKWWIEYRHKKGINKKYNTGISKTKEYKKMCRQKRKALIKGGGDLSIDTIQLVYEDNIKKYGTLTCYLCLNSILFGKDHLEHKTPLSRGGQNNYENLGVSCSECNCKKHTKTEEEYRKAAC